MEFTGSKVTGVSTNKFLFNWGFLEYTLVKVKKI